jgi:hypothetical protein
MGHRASRSDAAARAGCNACYVVARFAGVSGHPVGMRRRLLVLALTAGLAGCGDEPEREPAGLPDGPFAHDFATLERVTGAEPVAETARRALPGAPRSARFVGAGGTRFDVFGYRDGQSALRARASLEGEDRRVVVHHNLLVVVDDPATPGQRAAVRAIRDLGSGDGGP